MKFCRQWLLIFCALVLSGGQIFAAPDSKAERDYAAAVNAFNDGMYPRAEAEFNQFLKKFGTTANAPMAALLEAQAKFKQDKFSEAANLLKSRLAGAGKLTDQYIYWIAEAQFGGGDFTDAAETFVTFSKNYPDSPLQLRAVVTAASARAQAKQWPAVERLLEETNGVFQRAEKSNPGDELVSRGRLLLAQAKFARKNYSGARVILDSLKSQSLSAALDWQRADLAYQNESAAGDDNAALAAATNLLQIARRASNADWLAESAAARADELEKLNRTGEAIATYSENLATNAPAERQRQAILKIAALAIAQKKFSDAETNLENYLAQFPDAPAVDLAALTLGELELRNFAAQPAATNHLAAAQSRFNQFIGAFPNSPLLGKAYLDRGWCNWLTWENSGDASEISNSLSNFKLAAEKLPPSVDLAVARFKMGDALFAQNDFKGALENYQAVLGDDFTNFPDVKNAMGPWAYYQSLRADLQLTNMAGASNAMSQILKFYPTAGLADNSLLLVGESYEDMNRPEAARALYRKFDEMYPEMPLRARVDLAIARSYEREDDWRAAIGQYQNWLENFPTNALRPQADYALAWATFQAGDETNALDLFTKFLAQFPTNELSPQAQWWIGDYFYRLGGTSYVAAETNYEFIFQNPGWQNSSLIYPARMMAGRAALGRNGYKDAIRYFTGLINDTNCPAELGVQARFACGGALMQMPAADTNNPLANFVAATNVFSQIIQQYPTNEWGLRAQGEIGDCALQLGDYNTATNAYAQIFNATNATVSLRSEAKIGFGLALEKIAATLTGTNQTAILRQALNSYADVFYDNLADGFWREKAGLQALPLAESLGAVDVDRFIDTMESLFPQSRDALEKRRAAWLSAVGKN